MAKNLKKRIDELLAEREILIKVIADNAIYDINDMTSDATENDDQIIEIHEVNVLSRLTDDLLGVVMEIIIAHYRKKMSFVSYKDKVLILDGDFCR